MAGGRPPKLTDEEIAALMVKFEQYIEDTDIPIVAEFAYQNGLYKSYFYEHGEFKNLISMATSKKEAALERGGLTGALNVTMGIFSLKQLGWRDKTEQEVINTNIDATGMTPEERRNRISELLGRSDEE